MPKPKQFLKEDFRKKKPGKAPVVSDVLWRRENGANT